MKRLKEYLKEWGMFWVLWLAALVAVLIGKYQGRATAPEPEHDTIIMRDTMVVISPAPAVERFVPVERIDTVFIVEDYQMLRVYVDTIRTEIGDICVTDTVYKNQLQTQKVEYDLKFVPPDRTKSNAIAIGGGMSPMGAMATIQYRHKKWGYEGGYDFINRAPMLKISYDIIKW